MTTFQASLSPFHLHSSIPISPATALQHLTTFLETADIDAGYRPDSTLSERGPVSTSTSGNPNLTLHHLSRIKDGLQGKNLGSDDLEPIFPSQAESQAQSQSQTQKLDDEEGRATKKRKLSTSSSIAGIIPSSQPSQATKLNNIDELTSPTEEPSALGSQDWQDKAGYDEAQTEDEVDVHNAERNPGTNDVPLQPRNEEEAQVIMHVSTHHDDDDDVVMGESRPVAKARQKGKGKGKVQGSSKDEPVEIEDGDGDRDGYDAVKKVVDKEERKRLKKERAKKSKVTATAAATGVAGAKKSK